jgi:alkyldihydroxyacetonephosphate synthase
VGVGGRLVSIDSPAVEIRRHKYSRWGFEDQQPFAEALRAAKVAIDPAGIINPGVLIDPLP